MSEEEKNYRKWHTPDDWDRRVALLQASIEGAKRREERTRYFVNKRAWWKKRKETVDTYGV